MYASSMPEDAVQADASGMEEILVMPKRIRLKQEEVKLIRRAWMDVGTLGEFSGAAQPRSLHTYAMYGVLRST